MKKAILTIAVAAVAALSTYAQGLVIFNNTSTTRLSTNSVSGGAASGYASAAGGQNYYYALFYSTSSSTVNGSAASVTAPASGVGTWVTSDSSWTANTVLGTNSTSGRFASSSPNADGSTTVQGLAAGTTANFVVLAWSSNIGTSLAAFEAWLTAPQEVAGQTYYIGESAVGSQTAGNGGSIPNPTLFGTVSPGIPSFTMGVVTVPEPGTLALAALGGASLLLFRRKK